MGTTYIGPAGGLSKEDKETAKQWMVEGHSLLRGKVQGTVPARAAATITPGITNQTIPAGVYLSGEQTVAGDVNLAAENIRSGVSIFGVAGVLQQGYQVVAVGYYGVCRRTDSSGNNVQSGQSYGSANSTYGSLSGIGGIGGYDNAYITWNCSVTGVYRISGYRFNPSLSGINTIYAGATIGFTGIQGTGIVGSGVSSGCFTIEKLV